MDDLGGFGAGRPARDNRLCELLMEYALCSRKVINAVSDGQVLVVIFSQLLSGVLMMCLLRVGWPRARP